MSTRYHVSGEDRSSMRANRTVSTQRSPSPVLNTPLFTPGTIDMYTGTERYSIAINQPRHQSHSAPHAYATVC